MINTTIIIGLTTKILKHFPINSKVSSQKPIEIVISALFFDLLYAI